MYIFLAVCTDRKEEEVKVCEFVELIQNQNINVKSITLKGES